MTVTAVAEFPIYRECVYAANSLSKISVSTDQESSFRRHVAAVKLAFQKRESVQTHGKRSVSRVVSSSSSAGSSSRLPSLSPSASLSVALPTYSTSSAPLSTSSSSLLFVLLLDRRRAQEAQRSRPPAPHVRGGARVGGVHRPAPAVDGAPKMDLGRTVVPSRNLRVRRAHRLRDCVAGRLVLLSSSYLPFSN